MSEPAAEVDRNATEDLTRAFLLCVRGHHRMRPEGRTTVFEVLNALAAASAIVLSGAGPDPVARAFFEDALEQNIARGENRCAR